MSLVGNIAIDRIVDKFQKELHEQNRYLKAIADELHKMNLDRENSRIAMEMHKENKYGEQE